MGAAVADSGVFYGGSVHVYNLNWVNKTDPKQEKMQSAPRHEFGSPPIEDDHLNGESDESLDARLMEEEQDEEGLPSEENLDAALAAMDAEDAASANFEASVG